MIVLHDFAFLDTIPYPLQPAMQQCHYHYHFGKSCIVGFSEKRCLALGYASCADAMERFVGESTPWWMPRVFSVCMKSDLERGEGSC